MFKPGQLCKLQDNVKVRELCFVSKNTEGAWLPSKPDWYMVKVSKHDVLMVVALTEYSTGTYRSNCYVLLHGEKTVLCHCDLIEGL